jgi:hypothetical protein
VTGLLRTRLIPKFLAQAIKLERVQKAAFLTISQTGIEYRKSPLSESLPGLPDAAPHAGDRFPWIRVKFTDGGPREDLYQKLHDTRFTLILTGQLVPSGRIPGLDSAMQMLTIPANAENRAELERVKVPATAFYLLRPDGYVGLAGVHLDMAAVNRYVSERLHLTGGAALTLPPPYSQRDVVAAKAEGVR